MNELPERLLSRRFSKWFVFAWLPVLACAVAVRWHFSDLEKSEPVKVGVIEPAQSDEAAKVWEFSPKTKLPKEEASVRYVCFSPDGRTLAFPTEILLPFSPEEEAEAEAREKSRQSAASGKVRPVMYKPAYVERRRLHRRAEIQLWDVPSRRYVTSLSVPDDYGSWLVIIPNSITFSRGGTKLCLRGLRGQKHLVWNVASGTLLSGVDEIERNEFDVLHEPWDKTRELGFSMLRDPISGDKLWSFRTVWNPNRSDMDKGLLKNAFVELWHRTAVDKPWRMVRTLSSTAFKNYSIQDIALNRDGKILAVLFRDYNNSNKKLESFDTESLQSLRKLQISGVVYNIVFSPDGLYLLANGDFRPNKASYHRTAYFWNVENGDMEKTFRFSAIMNFPVFSPDGQWIASTNDKAVFVYPSPVYKPK